MSLYQYVTEERVYKQWRCQGNARSSHSFSGAIPWIRPEEECETLDGPRNRNWKEDTMALS
jgi:hypothetical protein